MSKQTILGIIAELSSLEDENDEENTRNAIRDMKHDDRDGNEMN